MRVLVASFLMVGCLQVQDPNLKKNLADKQARVEQLEKLLALEEKKSECYSCVSFDCFWSSVESGNSREQTASCVKTSKELCSRICSSLENCTTAVDICSLDRYP